MFCCRKYGDGTGTQMEPNLTFLPATRPDPIRL